MRQKLTTLLVSLLVIGAVAAVPMSGAAQFTGGDADASTSMSMAANNTTNATNETIAPGERLSGAVGVQNAELEGELETRTFGLKVAKANTDNAKADVVAEQLDESQKRLENLESKLEELRQARQNGTISKGEYAARASETKAKLNNVEKMANETANASKGIPNETLRANGVNVTAIQTLQQRAAELSGPEVADIARSIAGERGPKNVTDRGNRTATPDSGNRTAGTDTPTRNGTDTGGAQTTESPDGTDSGSGSQAGTRRG